MMRKILVAIVLLLTFMDSNLSFCQTIHLNRRTEGTGRLSVLIKKGDSTQTYYANCFMKDVASLPDTTKLRLIKELIQYLDDTSLCYMPVRPLYNRYYTYGKSIPESSKYNIQIDALILINYIAFSVEAFTYSPFPLLVDKNTKSEICCTGTELDYVVSCYKKWFGRLMKTGFKNYSFPLIEETYEWFGTRNVSRTFVSYPEWSSYYDCPQLKLEK